MDIKTDAIPMIFQPQWMWTHQYSLESDMPIPKRTRIASEKKEDASIVINEATWHMNAQRRNNNLDNLAKPISTDPNTIDLAPNLFPRRNLLDQSLWDKDSKRRTSSTTNHRSKLLILKMPKNRRTKMNKNTLDL